VLSARHVGLTLGTLILGALSSLNDDGAPFPKTVLPAGVGTPPPSSTDSRLSVAFFRSASTRSCRS